MPQAVSTEELSKEMQNGKLKVQTVCVTCHGMNGQATGAGNSVIIPNITAQEKNYMVARLKAYKAGEIKASSNVRSCANAYLSKISMMLQNGIQKLKFKYLILKEKIGDNIINNWFQFLINNFLKILRCYFCKKSVIIILQSSNYGKKS